MIAVLIIELSMGHLGRPAFAVHETRGDFFFIFREYLRWRFELKKKLKNFSFFWNLALDLKDQDLVFEHGIFVANMTIDYVQTLHDDFGWDFGE